MRRRVAGRVVEDHLGPAVRGLTPIDEHGGQGRHEVFRRGLDARLLVGRSRSGQLYPAPRRTAVDARRVEVHVGGGKRVADGARRGPGPGWLDALALERDGHAVEVLAAAL